MQFQLPNEGKRLEMLISCLSPDEVNLVLSELDKGRNPQKYREIFLEILNRGGVKSRESSALNGRKLSNSKHYLLRKIIQVLSSQENDVRDNSDELLRTASFYQRKGLNKDAYYLAVKVLESAIERELFSDGEIAYQIGLRALINLPYDEYSQEMEKIKIEIQVLREKRNSYEKIMSFYAHNLNSQIRATTSVGSVKVELFKNLNQEAVAIQCHPDSWRSKLVLNYVLGIILSGLDEKDNSIDSFQRTIQIVQTNGIGDIEASDFYQKAQLQILNILLKYHDFEKAKAIISSFWSGNVQNLGWRETLGTLAYCERVYDENLYRKCKEYFWKHLSFFKVTSQKHEVSALLYQLLKDQFIYRDFKMVMDSVSILKSLNPNPLIEIYTRLLEISHYWLKKDENVERLATNTLKFLKNNGLQEKFPISKVVSLAFRKLGASNSERQRMKIIAETIKSINEFESPSNIELKMFDFRHLFELRNIQD